MARKKQRMVLRFPAESVNEPITYKLIKDYDVMINILNADISHGREGNLLIEMAGEKQSMDGNPWTAQWITFGADRLRSHRLSKPSFLMNPHASIAVPVHRSVFQGPWSWIWEPGNFALRRTGVWPANSVSKRVPSSFLNSISDSTDCTSPEYTAGE